MEMVRLNSPMSRNFLTLWKQNQWRRSTGSVRSYSCSFSSSTKISSALGTASASASANARASTTVRTMTSTSTPLFKVHPEVQEALEEGRPIVALESTIVAHGMPYPQNFELACDVQDLLRTATNNAGVTPATIALKDGQVHIGLSTDDLHDLALAGQEGRAKKCSTRDLPLIMASSSMSKSSSSSSLEHHQIQWGATTVASTMRLAHLAGIETFCTGGIGGVHRDDISNGNGHNSSSMDISADLTELGQCPVVVVSAGIKSILDIPRTLEVLETQSVPTLGWKTTEFPAFFSPTSGMSCQSVDSADVVACAYWTARSLQLPQGMVVAVPNNDPAGTAVEDAIQAALNEASTQGISGQAVTPFILKRVAEETGGESLRSNIALVKSNAKVAAEIAIAIATTKQQKQLK